MKQFPLAYNAELANGRPFPLFFAAKHSLFIQCTDSLGFNFFFQEKSTLTFYSEAVDVYSLLYIVKLAATYCPEKECKY